MSLTPAAPAPRPPSAHDAPRWVVALPARDEAQRLPGALLALDAAAALAEGAVSVLVLANCCGDETAAIARALTPALPRLTVSVREAALPPGLAHAGGARAAAVAAAREAFGGRSGDRLLTTDADARLRPDALALAEVAFTGGADLVLAKIGCAPDPFDPAPEAAVAWGTPQVEWRHAVRTLTETLRTGARPCPPLHDDYGGAGIAVTMSAHDRLGGFAPVPSEEDLRLVRAADEAEMVVDRSCGCAVEVLTRMGGRARGGMAAALARNAEAAARGEPQLVEHHEETLARLLADPHHARAFARVVTRREPAAEATAALQRVIGSYAATMTAGPRALRRGAS